MKLTELPDIDFVSTDADTIEQAVFECYTNITGRTLSRGDPIRLFLLVQADVIIRLLNKFNYAAKQNLLKYSKGDYLDNLAANAWVTRIAASAAVTTIRATLSAARDVETIIPAGTRISPQDELYFATDEALIIPAGETTGDVGATCTTTGTAGNDYLAGEISTIVDPVAYVKSMVNITKSEGGSNIETDDALRERVWEAPEALSVAGPASAYRAHTKAVNSAIVDVGVDSPEPGKVRIIPLLDGGEVPGAELIAEIQTALSDKTVRPLTDTVVVEAPEVVSYDIDATYYIDKGANATQVQANVQTAVTDFISWEQSVLGRDIIPSRLIQKVMAVSGVKRIDVTAPVFTVVTAGQVAIAGTTHITMAGSEDE